MSPLTSLWISWLFTSTWPIAGQSGVNSISPVLFAWISAFLGALYFVPWAYRNTAWKKFARRDIIINLAGLGLFGSALPVVLFFFALQYTTPANAAILAQSEIVYSIILSTLVLRERLGAAQLTGTLMVLSGTILVAFNERFSPRWTGDLIVICTPWMYQVSHIYAKKLPADCPPEFIAAARTFYGTLFLTPLMLFSLFSPGFKFFITPGSVSAMLYWGLILAGFNNVLWYKAIRNMELSKASAIILSYPAMTTFLSWVLGRETLHGYQLAGLSISMAGAYWVTMLAKSSAKK